MNALMKVAIFGGAPQEEPEQKPGLLRRGASAAAKGAGVAAAGLGTAAAGTLAAGGLAARSLLKGKGGSGASPASKPASKSGLLAPARNKLKIQAKPVDFARKKRFETKYWTEGTKVKMPGDRQGPFSSRGRVTAGVKTKSGKWRAGATSAAARRKMRAARKSGKAIYNPNKGRSALPHLVNVSAAAKPKRRIALGS